MGSLLPATVTVRMELDVEDMLRDAVDRARTAAGEAPATPAQSAEAVARVLRDLQQQAQAQAAELQRRTREAQPEGVSLVEMASSQDGTTLRSTLCFELVDLKLLPRIAVAMEAAELAHPFAGFSVTRRQGQLELAGRSPELPAPSAACGRVQLELEAAAPARTHSATRVQGRRLVWEAPVGAAPLEVRATFAPR